MPEHDDAEELANCFSEYFESKIDAITSNFAPAEYVVEQRPPDPAHFWFTPVTTAQVRRVIEHSPCKSCILDPIPTSLLKVCINEILPIATDIINLSTQHARVPQAFKEAVVTPLIKKPAGGVELSNYRPVSNLPFLSKVLERIVINQLNQHCEEYNLLDPYQSAYKHKHSTETALLKIFDDLLNSMDKQQVSLLVLLDLSAAFDTVNHAILKERLHTLFGLNDSAIAWFDSYLTNRHQRVKVGNQLSAQRALSTGVPQGSGLGPWTYTSYTRELGYIFTLMSITYHLFADDTQLHRSFSVKSIDEQLQARDAMQQCLSEVSKWMLANKLKLNRSKTEIILIGTPAQLRKVVFDTVNIDEQAVPAKAVVKNLGVLIESDLKMKAQVNSVVKCCYRHLHVLRKMRSYLTTPALHTLVQAFVISRLDYANSLYFGIPEYLIDKLQRIQNMAARLICNIQRRDPVTPALIELHWLPVRERIIYKMCLLTFKCLHGLASVYLADLIH